MYVQILIPLLAFLSVLLFGTGGFLLISSRRNRIRERLNDGAEARAWGGAEAIKDPAEKLVERMGQIVSPGGASASLRDQLVRAGFRSASAPSIYLGTKFMLLFCAFIIIACVILMVPFSWHIKLFICLVVFGLFFFGPNLLVGSLGGKHSGEMRRHLPDVVDLLEVCVSGGMGLDQAWLAVSEEIRTVCPLLADEMALTNLEVHLGEERGKAIRRMADRTGVQDLASLVATIVQSEKYGTSIGEALVVFAENLREIRSMRAEEQAETMGVKLLVPMILFIFPVMFIVTVGPAAIKIVDAFSKM